MERVNARWEAVKWEVVRKRSRWHVGIARLQMLAGHAKSSIRPGHAALRGGNSGDILEKSRRAATLSITAGIFYATHKHGMRREACVLQSTLTRSPRGTITPQSPKVQAKHLTLAYHFANGVQKNMPKQVKRTSLLPFSDLH